MRWFLGFAVLFAGVSGCALAADNNVVLTWNRAALDAIRTTRTAPPMASRGLAIVHTAMYDAWAAYEHEARPVHLAVRARSHRGNRARAISFAAFGTLSDLFPSQRAVFAAKLAELGYDPADVTRSPRSRAGIGNLAADAVLAFRHQDGSNQLAGYADTTGYVPYNTVDQLLDPGKWQPLVGPNGRPQKWLAPYWGTVQPFGLAFGGEFRLQPPPAFGSAEQKHWIDELLNMSANLTDTDKMIVEYWADGAGTATPPGHWNEIAQQVSERDDHDLETDVKMFFVLNNALMDAAIAAWDTKRFYDFSRPITQLRFTYRDQVIRAWGGPGQGTVSMPGSQWLPYLDTPPFAEYPSGHSTFSAAAATVLRLFTGSDLYGGSVTFQPGASSGEPGLTPKQPVTLSWATFMDAAVEAGLSRRLGGIHFWNGDVYGRALGTRVGERAMQKAALFFGKTESHRRDAARQSRNQSLRLAHFHRSVAGQAVDRWPRVIFGTQMNADQNQSDFLICVHLRSSACRFPFVVYAEPCATKIFLRFEDLRI